MKILNDGKILVFGEEIKEAVEQIENCIQHKSAFRGVLCGDHHLGYKIPIGGVIAYSGFFCPAGPGYDIGCGIKGVETNIKFEDIKKDLNKIADEIVNNISFGIGRINETRVDHSLFDDPVWSELKEISKLKEMARQQLGTVGSGNHWINLFHEKTTGNIWVGTHFGSRGLGHKIASGFLDMAAGFKFGEKKYKDELMGIPDMIEAKSELGQSYLQAMELAGKYAYAGRDWVVDKVCSILGAGYNFSVHSHHNFLWEETHFGEKYFVVRKGATPCWPNQYGFIGSNMCDDSVVIKGVDSNLSKEALYSTVHGAGRIMGRMQAKGKWKKITDSKTGNKTYECVREPGVDEKEHKEYIKKSGIVLRGGDLDESPFVYKKLDKVLDAHKGTFEVCHTLSPIIVAMAGNEIDPYKD